MIALIFKYDKMTFVIYASDPKVHAPISPEIELDSDEYIRATNLADRLKEIISKEGVSPNIALGALAKLGLALTSDRRDNSGKRWEIQP